MTRTCVAAAVLALAASHACGQAAQPSAGADYSQMVSKAVEFLKTVQAEDGSYSKQAGPAVTALVTAGLLQNGRTPADPQVAKALKFLEGYVKPDGGIYDAEFHRNYETCVAMVCFAAANSNGKYNQILANAEKYTKEAQWDAGEGHDKSSVNYGGGGYGRSKRPDLSNTSFMLDALKAVGNGPDDPAVQRALVFVSRCQNLESAENNTPFAAKIGDGGFYYTPAAGGSSMAGQTDEGGLRSYGSMTYAGLKSMIFAGLTPEDPRVKAAIEWITKNYTVKENPGLGEHGLYYYYSLFAKSLDALGQDMLKDADGKSHDWRKELAEQLFSIQKENGSWVNTSRRWMETDPNLVTAFSLIALKYCEPREVAAGN